MTFVTFMLCLLLATSQARVGRVESTFDDNATFGAFRTYSWHAGYDAHDPSVHKMIVAALEDEMTKQGFTKVDKGADVTLAYYTIFSTEIDLEALDRLERKGPVTEPPTKSLGRLLIIMRKPNTDHRLWTASMHDHIDREHPEDTIRAAARRLFEKYPAKRNQKD
jgi:hypothetical protein